MTQCMPCEGEKQQIHFQNVTQRLQFISEQLRLDGLIYNAKEMPQRFRYIFP